MNSDQLRQFVSIVDCGAITKAAEKLYITQSALSISLNKLEKELNCQLFIRKNKKLYITQDGEKLLEYARKVVNTIEEASDYFSNREDNRDISVLRIGGISGRILMENIHDEKDFNIRSTLLANEDLKDLSSFEKPDIIIADNKYISDADYESTKLYDQYLMLCVEKGHRFSDLKEIEISKITEEKLMTRSNPLGFNNWLDDICKENNCSLRAGKAVDNVEYILKRGSLHMPYLTGSFGVGSEGSKEYFDSRKLIRVTGAYTKRTINVYQKKDSSEKVRQIVSQIVKNAKKEARKDREYYREHD